MHFEELITPRLRLRKLSIEVFDYIYATMDDDALMDFLGFTAEELAKDKAKYAKGLTTHNRSFTYFQIIDPQTNKVIGGCGYHTWYTDHNRAEIGYGLLYDDYKQKGLMSEAIAPVLEYGFNRMGLLRIEAMIGPANTASRALVTRFGFTEEGLLREHYFKNGKMEDSVVYSLLKREFIK